MKRNNLLILMLYLIFQSCSPDHEILPITGNIEGNVTLRRNDYALVTDMSGVKVSLEGIKKSVQVETDKLGHWIMKDIPSGTYNIIYTKDGYNSFKQFSVQHVGGSVSTWPYVDNLVALSAMTKMKVIKAVPSFDSENLQLAVTVTAPPSGEQSGAVIFFKHAGQATSTNYDFSSYVEYPTGGTFEKKFFVYFLKLYYGYKTGEEISVRLHGISGRGSAPDDIFRYFDPNLNLFVYPNISPESVDVKFKMP